MVNLTKLGYLIGEFHHNLTEKNRLAMPKRFRIEIEGHEVILAQSDEPCIEGFEKNKWLGLVKQYLNIPFTDNSGKQIRRRVFSKATVVEMDRQGRFVLPESMLAWAGLKGKVGEEVVIIGVGDHFEIWESTQFKQKYQTQ